MKTQYLFPAKWKKIGWFLFIPGLILGLVYIFYPFEPDFLNAKMPAIIIDNDLLSQSTKRGWISFGFVQDNLIEEIIGLLLIIGGILVAFSRVENEDEFITKIRLDSLVWAVYVNYFILLLAFLLFYGLDFLWVMVFNMFTVLFFFIFKFHWSLYKLKKEMRI